MKLHVNYKAVPSDQAMELHVEIEDGEKREVILTNVSIELRKELVPFLLSFETA